ncbi:hypothetical protein BDV10DRAFT_156719 [Aspergillus recurvatus]
MGMARYVRLEVLVVARLSIDLVCCVMMVLPFGYVVPCSSSRGDSLDDEYLSSSSLSTARDGAQNHLENNQGWQKLRLATFLDLHCQYQSLSSIPSLHSTAGVYLDLD